MGRRLLDVQREIPGSINSQVLIVKELTEIRPAAAKRCDCKSFSGKD